MSCQAYIDLISARLDGPLSEVEQVRLDDHLKTCRQCRVISGQLEQMHSAFVGSEVPAPQELSAGVMKSIRAERAGRKRMIRQLSALAACLVLCVGLFGLNRYTAPAEAEQDGAATDFFLYASEETSDQEAQKDASASIARAAENKTECAAGSAVLADSATADVCHHLTAGQRQIVLNRDVEPRAALITSVEQLSDFAAGLEGEEIAGLSAYNADFFAENTLVAVIHRAPTSGYTYRMEGVTGQTVFLHVTAPQTGDTVVTTTLILGQTVGITLPANKELNVSYR